MTIAEREKMKEKMNEWGCSHSSDFTNPSTTWIYRCPIDKCKMCINPRGLKRNLLVHINSKHKELEQPLTIEVYNKDKNKTHDVYAPIHRTMMAKLPLVRRDTDTAMYSQQEEQEQEDKKAIEIEFEEEGGLRQKIKKITSENSNEENNKEGRAEIQNTEKETKKGIQKRTLQETQGKQERTGPVTRGEHIPSPNPIHETENTVQNVAADEVQPSAVENEDYGETFRDYLLLSNDGSKRQKVVGRGVPNRRREEGPNGRDDEDEERQMHEGNAVLT